jgi:hypothetical protein
MKKLLIVAFAFSLASVSQAAQINWKFANENPSDFANQFVYAVSAANYSAAITDLTTNDGAKFLSDYNIANTDAGTDYQVKLNARGGGSGFTVLSGSDTQFALFVFKDGIVNGKDYYTTGLVGSSTYIYTPPDQVPATLELGTSAAAFATTGTIAPEPTSGLLMLLGMAGLALKRKRA